MKLEHDFKLLRHLAGQIAVICVAGGIAHGVLNKGAVVGALLLSGVGIVLVYLAITTIRR